MRRSVARISIGSALAAACLLMLAGTGQSRRNRHPQRNRPRQGIRPARNPLPRKSARPATSRTSTATPPPSMAPRPTWAPANQGGCHLPRRRRPRARPERRRERGRRRSQPGIEGSLRQRKERHRLTCPGRQARPLVREHPCEPRRELHAATRSTRRTTARATSSPSLKPASSHGSGCKSAVPRATRFAKGWSRARTATMRMGRWDRR